jgi:hypothetical protein
MKAEAEAPAEEVESDDSSADAEVAEADDSSKEG